MDRLCGIDNVKLSARISVRRGFPVAFFIIIINIIFFLKKKNQLVAGLGKMFCLGVCTKPRSTRSSLYCNKSFGRVVDVVFGPSQRLQALYLAQFIILSILILEGG